MTQVEKHILFRVALWVSEGNRRVVEKIRELAETEENYMVIIRELDRVTGQITQARKIRAPATLTLLDWFVTLEDFHWQCAYCQMKPFQIMCHPHPLAVKGTTPVPPSLLCVLPIQKERKRSSAKLSCRERVSVCEGEQGACSLIIGSWLSVWRTYAITSRSLADEHPLEDKETHSLN